MQNFHENPKDFPIPRYCRVLVCGGRDYEDWKLIEDVLDHIKPAFIVTGGQGRGRPNRGADHHAENYAQAHGVPYDVVHADWDAFGRSAGPRRNSQILILHPRTEWAIGFPGGKGTADMLNKARACGIPAIAFDFDGNYQKLEEERAD